jgi:hypothetical protein
MCTEKSIHHVGNMENAELAVTIWKRNAHNWAMHIMADQRLIPGPIPASQAGKTRITGEGRMSTRTGRTPVTAIGEPELILPRALRRRKCNRACL